MDLLLAGDLGGTKTLLALYGPGQPRPVRLAEQTFVSGAWPGLAPMVQQFLVDHRPQGGRCRAACLAVAGPVAGERAHITNLGWELRAEELSTAADDCPLELINDFAVLVYALPLLAADQQAPLQIGTADPAGPLAILGAGTGLGMARGIRRQGTLQALPSEGGHRCFAPETEEEWELSQWLRHTLGLDRLSVERVVSGTGLGHIASWRLGEVDGHPLQAEARAWRQAPAAVGGPDLPALVSAAAANGDPAARSVVDLWLGAYGSAAGDLAVHEMATGGLWVGGGTARKQLQGLQSPRFLERMRRKGRFTELVAGLPVTALTDPGAGLFGAACRAQLLAECG